MGHRRLVDRVALEKLIAFFFFAVFCLCFCFVFSQPLLTSLYQLLIFLVGCPDSAASVRSIRLCHRLLPVCIGSGNPLALQLYARVFDAGLVALSSATQQSLDIIEMELIALLKVANTPNILAQIRGKRIRVIMDSIPALRNLIKGGGPVPEL